MRDYIDAIALRDMVLCADEALCANVRLINELNVFPVPDGDTGTNMSLTMNAAAAELRKREYVAVDAVADCVAGALLRGARGNSGVILSLLFRGISRKLKGMETAAAADFAAAMNDGVDAAYKAVMKPAEGTILTVARLASAAAAEAAKSGCDIEAVLSSALDAGREALDDTMNINPVLAKAGVVDAGGKGYVVILEAFLAYLRGEAVVPEKQSRTTETEGTTAFDKFTTEEITFTFDTVFIVRKAKPVTDLAPLRAYLSSIGDCLVISEGDDEFKVHVHTDIPGEALTRAQRFGTLELAKIENMRTQHDDLVAGRKAQSTDDLEEDDGDTVSAPEKKFGVVSVCAGSGMEELFRELGCDSVVTGGQTMNPSTEDILREINRTPAEVVFVLPNNKNIIMAAEQCVPICQEKKVVVIPTKTVPQGITAMFSFNPDGETEGIVEDMTEAIGNVHTALVTYAARDSDFDGHAIHSGEYLALLDGKLLGSYSNMKTLLKELSWSVNDFEPEMLTVYYGEDVSEEEAAEAADVFSGCFPDAEVSIVNGGQPVYYYTIAIE